MLFKADVRIPKAKRTPSTPKCHFPIRPEVLRPCRLPPGTPLAAPFLQKNSVVRTLWEKWRPERPKVGPRAAKGAQMEPQSSLWGALGRLFSRKTAIVGPCQNLTPTEALALKCRSGASLGGPKAPLFRVGGAVRSLGAFLWRPGRKKGPKEGPKMPQGTPK